MAAAVQGATLTSASGTAEFVLNEVHGLDLQKLIEKYELIPGMAQSDVVSAWCKMVERAAAELPRLLRTLGADWENRFAAFPVERLARPVRQDNGQDHKKPEEPKPEEPLTYGAVLSAILKRNPKYIGQGMLGEPEYQRHWMPTTRFLQLVPADHHELLEHPMAIHDGEGIAHVVHIEEMGRTQVILRLGWNSDILPETLGLGSDGFVVYPDDDKSYLRLSVRDFEMINNMAVFIDKTKNGDSETGFNEIVFEPNCRFAFASRAVYLRVAGANNSIVRDARVFLASPWSRRRLTMGPYSMDLRERVAAAIDEGEGSERQIAKRFRVSVSFVTRLLQRRRDAGTLAPKPHGGGPRPVLGFPEQVRLAMLIAEHPDATLNQLKEWGGFACTLTTLWRTLRRFRLTYKKKTLHAGERDTPEVQAKRRRYRAKVRRIEAKRLVFVDETGVNTAMTPTHAWARRGERAEGSVPSAWGSTTVIAALGLDGVRAPLIFPGATDTQAFQTYVDQVLVPELRPGDVVVFDNLKPHLSRHVAESIERAGATVLPLPPYSSDYDPIEELWSKFKGQLRRIAARTKDGLYKAVGETLDSVTIQDILGWFNHSGLYATHG